MTLTVALALTILTPAVASARPAVSQKVLADTCDPVSGTRTYYSLYKWSKANARICVQVQQRADGSKALYVDYAADFFYYWGAAWYSDCRNAQEQCTVKGRFTLRRGNGALVEQSNFLSHPAGSRHEYAAKTFNVDSGRWRVEATAEKSTGYWAFHRTQPGEVEDVVPMNDFAVEVDVP
ncbi:hypothetical protein [Nonomuraea sp. NPDC050786]|uniref:hypothetical protein n=1 Tax=Nonomuraea sp. NPDC050786 TaxID=3154840 RepID=UPI0033F88D2E